jgi:hypothetical protein
MQDDDKTKGAEDKQAAYAAQRRKYTAAWFEQIAATRPEQKPATTAKPEPKP